MSVLMSKHRRTTIVTQRESPKRRPAQRCVSSRWTASGVGHLERESAKDMIARYSPGAKRITVGADKGFDSQLRGRHAGLQRHTWPRTRSIALPLSIAALPAIA